MLSLTIDGFIIVLNVEFMQASFSWLVTNTNGTILVVFDFGINLLARRSDNVT